MLKLTDIDMNTDLIISVSLVYTCIQLNTSTHNIIPYTCHEEFKEVSSPSCWCHPSYYMYITCTCILTRTPITHPSLGGHVHSPELPLPILV